VCSVVLAVSGCTFGHRTVTPKRNGLLQRGSPPLPCCKIGSSGWETNRQTTNPHGAMPANYSDPFSVDALAAELIAEYNKLEKAKDHFERLKGDFLKKLTADNIGAVKVKEGTITVCTRTSKDYGQTVKVLEANLKAEKTRLDHLGEFVIKNVTHFLRFG